MFFAKLNQLEIKFCSKRSGSQLKFTFADYICRKSSKPEVKIAEPRPACEGRASKAVTETSPSRPVSGRVSYVRTKSSRGNSAPSMDDDEEELDEDGESLE